MNSQSLWRDKKIVVVGMGMSGQAAAQLAAELGARVTVMDHKADFPAETLQAMRQANATLIFGRLDEKTLREADLIVLSPGVPPDLAEIASARKTGVAITGEIEWAVGFLTSPSIAVTGTNGKTTTTSLIGHGLKSVGRKVFVGGNIGSPLAGLAAGIQRGELEAPEVMVLELSSYQLETVQAFCPKIGLILNFALNHQDRYRRFEDYVEAKARLFRNMKAGNVLILNSNDEHCRRLGERAKVQGVGVVFFDDREPSLPHLPGRHNRENMGAARLALAAMGLGPQEIRRSFESFQPVAHRLERLRAIAGVDFFNDSKATTVHAAAAALEALSEGAGKILWIAGGYDQGEDFAPLKKNKSAHVRAAFFIGASGPRLAEALGGTLCASLEEALRQAQRAAQSGDHVLFSPAAKSFDRYRNFEERGEHFRRLVEAL